MFSVCLIGPDGVGKTTVATHLVDTFPLSIKYLYMGDNVNSSNYMLPTTRWWKSRKRKKNSVITKHNQQTGTASYGKKKVLTLPLTFVKKTLGFTNRILDEWYRQLVALYFKRRGFIVLFDRHFIFDYYHFDIHSLSGRRPFKRKLHGFFLRHTMPQPDLVICLDAPAEVVFKRKREFSIEFLQVRRSQYLNLKNVVSNFKIVDTNRDLDKVIHDVGELIHGFYKKNIVHTAN